MKLCSSDSYYTLTPLRLSYWERKLKVGFPLKPKMLNLPFLFNITHHQKIESPHPFPWSRTTYWKKDISHSFRQIVPIILSVVLSWFIWKTSTELSVNKKQYAVGLCPRIIPAVSPSDQKCLTPLMLLCCLNQVSTVPFSMEPLLKTLGMGREEKPTQQPNTYSFPPKKNPFQTFKIFIPHQIVFLIFHVITRYKLHLLLHFPQ